MDDKRQFFPELIPFRDGERFGYCDRNRKTLIKPDFSVANPFLGGVARVFKGDKGGIIDKSGKILVPLECEEVGEIYQGDSWIDRSGVYFLRSGKYGYCSLAGDVISEAKFSNITELYHFIDQSTFSGCVIPEELPKDFPSSSIKNMDEVGKFENGSAPFRRGNQWGIISDAGEVLLEPRYEKIEACGGENFSYLMTGRWGLLDRKGKVLLEPQYEEVRPFSNGQAACKSNGKWGGVNASGEWDFSPVYEDLGEYCDGLTAAKKADHFGFVDRTGKPVIEFTYKYVLDFKDGVCGVYPDSQSFHFIDVQGKKISDVYIPIHNAANSVHVMAKDKWGIFGVNGTPILPVVYDLPKVMGQTIEGFHWGLTPIKRGALMGFASADGAEVFPPQYMTVDTFTEGFSVVSVLNKAHSFGMTPESMEATGAIGGSMLYGYLEHNGKILSPPKYQLARRFSYGLAYVEPAGRYGFGGYIDYSGQEYFNF